MVRIMSSTHVAMYVRAKCNKQLDRNLCMVASHGSQVANGGKATVASHGLQVANGPRKGGLKSAANSKATANTRAAEVVAQLKLPEDHDSCQRFLQLDHKKQKLKVGDVRPGVGQDKMAQHAASPWQNDQKALRKSRAGSTNIVCATVE